MQSLVRYIEAGLNSVGNLLTTPPMRRPKFLMKAILRIARLQVTFFVILLAAATVYATDYYVDDDGSNETGNGTQGNPWKTISWALAQVSGTGHTIHVGPGIYDTVMDGVWAEIFPIRMKDGVSLIGAGADSTILDADSTATVIRCEGISDTTTRIEAFTIRNGGGSGISLSSSSPTITGNTITGNSGDKVGGISIHKGSPVITENTITGNSGETTGGIYVSTGSPRITSNTITGNSGENAGGIYVSKGSPVITNNTIARNTGAGIFIYYYSRSRFWGSPVVTGNTITGNSKAGIYVYRHSPMIAGNTITENGGTGISISIASSSATITGNTITENGGTGISISSSACTITDNVITGNSATGISISEGSPVITENTITRNQGYKAGGIYVSTGSPRIANNTIIGNSARGGKVAGGIYLEEVSSRTLITNNIIGNQGQTGIYVSSSSPTLTNNTIVGNERAIYLEKSSPRITNNIISDTSEYGIYESDADSDPTVTYNLFHNNLRGPYYDENESKYSNIVVMDAYIPECSNNIEADPLFADAANGDYHLQEGSPAIDAGNPDPKYNDPDGTRSDIGAFYYPQEPVGPRIHISASAHDFDSTYVGHSEEWTLPIRNVGTDVLNVSDMSNTWSEFLLSHTSAAIPTGDSLKVTITFTPPAQGTYQDTLAISSNDPDMPTVKIALSGEGFALIGDFDLDGEVDFDDFFLFAAKFGLFSSSQEFDATFDLDDSGRIDFDDLFLFGEHFGERAPVAKPVARLTAVHPEARLRLVESALDPMGTGELVLNVVLDGMEAWTGYGLRVRYDSKVMDFVRAQDGAGVDGDGGSLFLVVPKGLEEVIVASGRMRGQSPRSERLLTRLYFKSIGDEEQGTIKVTEGMIRDVAHRTMRIGDLSVAGWSAKPVRCALGQNRPNPFNAETVIPYRLTVSGWVKMSVYDITGKRIKVLVDGVREAGDGILTWDGRDEAGRFVGSGVYLLRMQAGTFISAKKLVLIR